MQMVIFIGAQASGKSSFYRQRFSDSHIRINLDMLRTRCRESILIKACFESSQSFVVDNMNSCIADRRKYFELCSRHCCDQPRVVGFYFQSSIENCIRRNQGRAVVEKIPDHAIAATVRKLELPSFNEGFDALRFVRIADGNFVVEDWKL